jgi:hypothetical protein
MIWVLAELYQALQVAQSAESEEIQETPPE